MQGCEAPIASPSSGLARTVILNDVVSGRKNHLRDLNRVKTHAHPTPDAVIFTHRPGATTCTRKASRSCDLSHPPPRPSRLGLPWAAPSRHVSPRPLLPLQPHDIPRLAPVRGQPNVLGGTPLTLPSAQRRHRPRTSPPRPSSASSLTQPPTPSAFLFTHLSDDVHALAVARLVQGTALLGGVSVARAVERDLRRRVQEASDPARCSERLPRDLAELGVADARPHEERLAGAEPDGAAEGLDAALKKRAVDGLGTSEERGAEGAPWSDAARKPPGEDKKCFSSERGTEDVAGGGSGDASGVRARAHLAPARASSISCHAAPFCMRAGCHDHSRRGRTGQRTARHRRAGSG